MSFKHIIDTERRLGVLEVAGEITGTMLVEAVRALADDPGMEPEFGRLWDWRGITLLDVRPEEFQQLLRQLETRRMKSVAIAIVAQREVDLNFARLITAALKRRRRIEVFTSMAEAVEWIQRL